MAGSSRQGPAQGGVRRRGNFSYAQRMHTEQLLQNLEMDHTLLEPDAYRERVDALERLENCVLASDGTRQRADVLRMRLEGLNQEVHRRVRTDIQRGVGLPALQRWVHGPPVGDGYDHLDELVAGVLDLQPPDDPAPLPPEMVAYQPTPARHIVDLVERCALTQSDVFVDVGSGLGLVPLVAGCCSQARCVGVELEPSYVRTAMQSARSLGLGHVEFLAQDARTAELQDGTVFYLYTPFVGSVMRVVLERLRLLAAARPVRVCTFGPCTQVVAREAWLHCNEPLRPDRVAIFQSTR